MRALALWREKLVGGLTNLHIQLKLENIMISIKGFKTDKLLHKVTMTAFVVLTWNKQYK